MLNKNFRRNFLFLSVSIIFLCVPLVSEAVRAVPRQVSVTQSDGSTITVRIYGDEKFHYTTTVDGYLIAQRDGIYYYATAQTEGIKISSVRASDPVVRTASEADFLFFKSKGVSTSFKEAADRKYQMTRLGKGLDTGFPTKGKIRSLVLLVNFSDKKFQSSTAKDDFDRLLNMEGYSDNGATGSARDYFVSNSNGEFLPDFDVYGPIDLPKTASYYGENDRYGIDLHPEEMVAEACRLAKEKFGVDFSKYDYNNDGILDNVFVFYAGTNEAEGGGDYTIWPHRAELDEDLTIDGKKISIYACTSEISLAGGYPVMAGIGTFCHEFGHVLGWPDFYDTDGEVGGLSEGVWDWSLMCVGSYNNNGRTPPAIGSVERMHVGWITPEELVYTGNYELEDLLESNKAYLIKTDMENEVFILENRQNVNSWDRYIGGHGLVIWHVDRSERRVEGYSASDRWAYNMPNNVKSHQCYRMITARPGSNDGYQAYMPFPGAGNKTEFSANTNPENVSWSGARIDAELFGIREEGDKVFFRAVTSNEERYPVKGVKIQGRNTGIVNDTIMLKAEIIPANANNKNVSWKSSNEKILTVNEKGIVSIVASGNAKITVETEDGGFTDELEIIAEIRQLFRARVITSSKLPIENASLTISGGEKTYKAVSSAGGQVLIEDIPAGEYLLEIEHPDWKKQTKGLNILEGASVCDLIMFSESEMESGMADFNINVTEYESSAYLSWPGSKAECWKVEWREKDNPESVRYEMTNVKKMDITGLKKNTEYSAVVSEMGKVIEGDFRKINFKTKESTSPWPVMLLHPMYEKGEVVLLKAANIPEGASLSWIVDGVETDKTEFVAVGPEHEIRCVVKSNGKSEVMTKYIKVVE